MSKPAGALLLEEYLKRIQRPDETLSEAVERFAREVAGVSPRTVWRWLSGEGRLSTQAIQKIHRALEAEEDGAP